MMLQQRLQPTQRLLLSYKSHATYEGVEIAANVYFMKIW